CCTLMILLSTISTLFPYTTLFRSIRDPEDVMSIYSEAYTNLTGLDYYPFWSQTTQTSEQTYAGNKVQRMLNLNYQGLLLGSAREDRKSTRLNSSHVKISYAVFCLK